MTRAFGDDGSGASTASAVWRPASALRRSTSLAAGFGLLLLCSIFKLSAQVSFSEVRVDIVVLRKRKQVVDLGGAEKRDGVYVAGYTGRD